MLRVVIADDHPVVLKGLKEIIKESFDNSTIDETSTGYGLLRSVEKNEYDLVLLDISLPDINGLEVLKTIKKIKPRLAVLIVSMYTEEHYAIRAIKAGAHGYITKRTASDDLVRAVRHILSGRRYISPSLAEKIMFDFELDIEQPHHNNLSDRELQVLCMIGRGMTVKEISEELHLSSNTIRTFRSRILEKLGEKRTSGLVHYAIKHNLNEQ